MVEAGDRLIGRPSNFSRLVFYSFVSLFSLGGLPTVFMEKPTVIVPCIVLLLFTKHTTHVRVFVSVIYTTNPLWDIGCCLLFVVLLVLALP